MFRITITLIGLFLFLSCETDQKDPQLIIDKAIKVSGGSNYDQFELEFDFRKRHYISKRDFGTFTYQRITSDSKGEIRDTYSSQEPFRRIINGVDVAVPDSLSQRIENSINSVNYFVLLPYGLNDEAVNKTYLGEVVIRGENYQKIKVTFSEEGGGDDFEDIFTYWIHSETNVVDYLAYQFFTNGGGLRFREAYNPRTINGIRFVDYNNYKPKSKGIDLTELDQAFEKGELELLSKIETENISVVNQ
ncbi:MAG: hypothetical protein HKO67_01475 [Flavobacteriaceae bacterium]|nr:hypothetical protein [Flavobacteriaceae bacterium]